MSGSGWKGFERRLARDLGVERIPVTGERAGSDASTDKVCLQFKLRKALPKWLWEWLGGIVGTAQKVGKVGALVIKIPRMQDEEALVILRWADFVTLHVAPPCCRPQDIHWRTITEGVCKRCTARWERELGFDSLGSDAIARKAA